jgi:thiamine-monophosphate kinase
VPAATPPTTLGSLGETALVEAIRRWLGPANPPPPAGIGDDCAAVDHRARRLLLTVDPVIRGRHFDDALPPRLVAEKLLKRNLSDIAAMGGRPLHAVIALTAPPDLEVAWLERFYRALARCARRHGVLVVGGDCTRTDGFLGAYLTLTGAPGKNLLTRTGARQGDVLFVTGRLGGSLLGRHARFTPRLAEGAWLASTQGVHAAIDLSDGLGKDLSSIVPDGLCARVQLRALPVSADARRAAAKDGRPCIDHVLNDGEDFELLFAVARTRAAALEQGWKRRFRTPLTRIGSFEKRLQGSNDAVCFDPPLPADVHARGYEHFR